MTEGTFFSMLESRIFSGRMVNTGRAFVYWKHQQYTKEGSDAKETNDARNY